jgi:uroporphyrinogen decarboxylase
MNQSERFQAVFRREKPDRLPVYCFGYWTETIQRWKSEGLNDINNIPGMDADWEQGLWDCHGLVNINPIGNFSHVTIEETDDYVVFQNSLGEISKNSKKGSSIPQKIKHALEPKRKAWELFKTFLDAGDKRRFNGDWEQKAEDLAKKDRVLCFMGGSLYSWAREWMGVENISYMMYDDPVLLEEIVSYLTEYFMVLYKPVLEKLKFDFVYFFEDCCCKTGPLFSPDVYRRIFDPYYKKMIKFYKANGVPLALIDSDGNTDDLIQPWMESGFDIIFPVEVGTWGANPAEHRKRFGRHLNMFGGVDKHVIPLGEAAVRKHLLSLKPAADEGGYIPIPDHRIPPECSYNDFLTYIKVFNEVFNF